MPWPAESVIAQNHRRPCHKECVRFLIADDTAGPKGLDLHLVLGNSNGKLRRSAHLSVIKLEIHICSVVNEWDKNAKPFVWA